MDELNLHLKSPWNLMTAQPEPNCPLCRSAKIELRHRITIPEIGDRVVARCPQCGYGWVLPIPTMTELEQFYSKEYFEDESGGRGFDGYLSKTYVHRGEGWLIGRRLRREKANGRALDVGCGSGDFLRGVQEASGWQAFGTDLSAYIIDHARRQSDLQLFCGDLMAAAYPAEYFDVVFLRNVLEHVPDPVALISEVRRILAPAGLLWLLVPNGYTEIAPMAAANRQGSLANDIQGHLNFFTPKCFRDWLRRCGFEVEQIYTLGLKRGLFCLGYLPQGWKLSVRRSRASQPKPSRTLSGDSQALPGSSERIARGWKHTLTYAYVRRFLKTSLKLPLWLPLGQELHAVVRVPARREKIS